MSPFTFHFPLSTQANQLPDLPAGPLLDSIRGPVEIPLFETWQLISIGLLTAILFGILANRIIRTLHAHTKCLTTLTDEQIARLAIEQADGDDREYTQTLTQAVRNYLNTHLKRPILSQTSEETLQHLPPNFPITASELQAFFQQCDAIKFAQASLLPEQRIELSDTALQLIETVQKAKKEALKQ